jgi:hypothetical protein
MHPLAILALAIVLPGAGQVFNREPVRGLVFVFFMLLLGGFTLQTASPEVSIVGKLCTTDTFSCASSGVAVISRGR